MNLKNIGWNKFFDKELKNYDMENFCVGRISSEHRGAYKIFTCNVKSNSDNDSNNMCKSNFVYIDDSKIDGECECEFECECECTDKNNKNCATNNDNDNITDKDVVCEITGEISGKMRFKAEETGNYPAVGDWVVISLVSGENKAIIHDILARKSKFSRKTAGITTTEQIVAANMDYVFLVAALNRDFNLRRLERYLIVAWESGATPVIILSKADLCENLEETIESVKDIAPGVPVHAVSAYTKEGFDTLEKYLVDSKSVVLLGSSGVGKSTIINELMGQNVMVTQEISEANSKGRHTTTHRQLILLKNGGIILDTPGMRELQLWDGKEGISGTFEDIEKLSTECRFNDCKHNKEPGCAIKEAIRNGNLSTERYESYKKLQKELEFIERKQKQMELMSSKKKCKTTFANTRASSKANYNYEQ